MFQTSHVMQNLLQQCVSELRGYEKRPSVTSCVGVLFGKCLLKFALIKYVLVTTLPAV